MEVIWSFETSVPTTATRRNISEYGIVHSYRRENLKSYTIGHSLEDWNSSNKKNAALF
jgi:hypothetical protein